MIAQDNNGFLNSSLHKGEVQDKNQTRTVMAKPQPAGELDAVALETALLNTWSEEKAFQNSIDSRRTAHRSFSLRAHQQQMANLESIT